MALARKCDMHKRPSHAKQSTITRRNHLLDGTVSYAAQHHYAQVDLANDETEYSRTQHINYTSGKRLIQVQTLSIPLNKLAKGTAMEQSAKGASLAGLLSHGPSRWQECRAKLAAENDRLRTQIAVIVQDICEGNATSGRICVGNTPFAVSLMLNRSRRFRRKLAVGTECISWVNTNGFEYSRHHQYKNEPIYGTFAGDRRQFSLLFERIDAVYA